MSRHDDYYYSGSTQHKQKEDLREKFKTISRFNDHEREYYQNALVFHTQKEACHIVCLSFQSVCLCCSKACKGRQILKLLFLCFCYQIPTWHGQHEHKLKWRITPFKLQYILPNVFPLYMDERYYVRFFSQTACVFNLTEWGQYLISRECHLKSRVKERKGKSRTLFF